MTPSATRPVSSSVFGPVANTQIGMFFGTDYPGFLYEPVKLRVKLLSVNAHAERVGAEPIPQAKLDGILGDNYARMLGLLS